MFNAYHVLLPVSLSFDCPIDNHVPRLYYREVSPTPTRFLQENRRRPGTRFAGCRVNVQALAEQEGLEHTRVWRILTGRGTPSAQEALAIANGLGMDLSEFIEALPARPCNQTIS